jgi:transposase-like protein
MVELLRRYSNQASLLTIMMEILERIKNRDQTAEPGVCSVGGLGSIGARRLSEADRAQIVEGFRRGVRIRELADRFGISEGCVKRTLRRHGVGGRERY